MTSTAPSALDLSGPWLLRADPDDRGLREGWYTNLAAWDQDRTMRIPGAWQLALGPDYHGIAWLGRTGRIPSGWKLGPDHRLRLRFESIATDATVFVNGIEVGRHTGDYVPFEFDITDAVAAAADADHNFDTAVRIDEMYAGRPPAGELTERGHITKGFHDVLSLQHGGIWDNVTLRATGRRTIIPDGIQIVADSERRRIHLRIEFEGQGNGELLSVSIGGGKNDALHLGGFDLRTTDAPVWERSINLDDRAFWLGAAPSRPRPPERQPVPVRAWSPDSPDLYGLWVSLLDPSSKKPTESHCIRFGFRTASAGGPDHRHILLNGRPLLLRGVLHWGHEPEHIAPAPTREQLRREFARLKELGFNCVCLCMWYPPRYFYDIADEMGMLLWQEHPVWKSPMEEELIPDYQRMFEKFFRRDRNHPSIVIVSGSCEHERIHPDLAAWWWKRAKEENPDRLVQVQTAFIGWVNPDQTDLHDEHVYDSSGRWVKFCDDLQTTLAELPPKPFVMGETIIGTSWVDAEAVRAAATSTDSPPNPQSAVQNPQSSWWFPKGLAECEAFERAIAARYGGATLERFKASADHLNLEQRKFQSEVLRMVPGHAGWVMNQIRDVPNARLGFMDDLGRWRFTPEQTRPWLSDQILLLRTPDHRRGFIGGREVPVEIGVSNFGGTPFEGAVEVRVAWNSHARTLHTSPIRAALGEIAWSAPLLLPVPAVDRPTRLQLQAIAPQIFPNTWDLWALPAPSDVPEGVVRLDGLPYSKKDLEPEFEERAYSSGWGLKVRTWKAAVPHPEAVLFKAPLWRFDAPLPPDTRIVVTHKLTRSLVSFLESGGRVLLLANRSPGGLGAKFINLWGQVPLIIEEGPLSRADSASIAELLHHDLTRRYTRAIPVEDLGLTDRVDPIIRLVFTHDRGSPRLMDAAFAARIGESGGVLLATSLDHTEDAGRWLLHRFLDWLAEDPQPRSTLLPDLVRTWACC